ncbi:diguanylate cyclase [Aliiglaciecola litoralis]|uniref:diguanylate cyclase n=1 Tax=Aliiglaciecola litoralis TaxID=582857 RepID=A0ABP3WR50_9ALTE
MQPTISESLNQKPLSEARILVVDDDAINQEMYRSMLADKYKVFYCENGQEAVEFCARHRPDLVIMDVEMPEMDGWTASKKIREIPELNEIPILFSTAVDSTNAELNCWESGGSDFMQKPLNRVTLVNRVRTHLTLKMHSDLLKKLAFLDGLTQQYNRRYFEECIPKEFALAMRNKTALSLLMIDIDFFKAYNDRYGHLKGDDCLRLVAKVIGKCMSRPTDIVARYGGEEFVCVLPQTDNKGAADMSYTIREAVLDLNILHEDSEFGQITVSIGMASISGYESGYFELLSKADAQLYQAKDSGRNCISGLRLK